MLFIIQICMVYVPWLYYANWNIYLCECTRRFILVHISRRTHSYSYSSYTILNLYIYLDGGTYHVIILLSILYLFRFPVGVTELMIIQRYSYTYWYLYLSHISRRSLQNLCLYRGTLRYYKTYTYIIGLILILQRLHMFGGTRRYYRDITERILILRNLSLYGSTRKYYKTYTGTSYLILVLRSISWPY